MTMVLEIDDSAVAIVGMAGRFPGANSVSELWDLLKNGKDALSPISTEELLTAGVDEERIDDPKYVKYCMKVENADCFDADFFGYSPRQAANINPQQRVFLECAWEALENAGHQPNSSEESVGVFAGSGFSAYLLDTLFHQSKSGPTGSLMDYILDNDKDFLAARVAYKLGLTGPSISVQTACSTSLVAVHLACQSLLTGECDLALAGGVTISTQSRGYRYVEHGILSSDGRCRAFDAEANGTVPGNGAAVVVLRRLTDALNKGYRVHAIIKSTIVNNDGSQKVSFTAPGLNSQRRLYATGLALAGLHPSDIGYIEAHGTGTVLGDSIELTGLKDVYGRSSRSCALGSIKTNIGHLDSAAGVAGLIKAILCLKNKALAPSLGYVTPNPLLQEPGCSLYVNTTFKQWEPDGDRPRRAAVSAFGLGGTNAHVILEEAPEQLSDPNRETAQILPLSARTLTALGHSADNLAEFLEQNQDTNIADIAYTLQAGRKSFAHRRFVVGRGPSDLVAMLRDHKQEVSKALDIRPVVFLFPCESSLWPGMAKNLYLSEKYFRDRLDQCADRINTRLAFDVRRFLCDGELAGDSKTLPAVHTQATLFAIEYSLTHLWLSWGVTPNVMFGHGLGEYVAASVADVISMEDAVKLVVERAKLIGQLQVEKMIAVDVSEERLGAMLGPELVVATINSPNQCVIAGPAAPIEEFIHKLESELIGHHCMETAHPLHYPMMTQTSAPLREYISTLKIGEPKLGYISCVTGGFISSQQVEEPSYWEKQMSPIRFTQGLAALRDCPGAIFLEVGPGYALSDIVHQQMGSAKDSLFLYSMPGDVDRGDLLGVLGKLWSEGASVDWERLHHRQIRRRAELPTYPFERQRYIQDIFTNNRVAAPNSETSNTDLLIENSFYMPSWKESAPWAHWKKIESALSGLWVVFEDEAGFGSCVADELRTAGCNVVSVIAASHFSKARQDKFLIDPRDPDNYARLISELKGRENNVLRLVHCWSLMAKSDTGSSGAADEAVAHGYRSLLFLTQALSELDASVRSSLLAVTTRLFDVAGEGAINFVKGGMPAICMVASQELANLRCGVMDLPANDNKSVGLQPLKRYVSAVLAEVSLSLPDPIVAYRGKYRLTRAYERMRLNWDMPKIRRIREKGVYLITGGLGRIGLVLSQELAHKYQARLILMSRSPFPAKSDWNYVLTQSARDNPIVARIQAIQKMEEAGAQVIVASADVSNPEDVQRVISDAQRRFGRLNGVFHLAGDLGHESAYQAFAKLTQTDIDTQARPKIDGFNVLNHELRNTELDFGVVFSSNSSILGGMWHGAYAAANALMDHLLLANNGVEHFQWLVTNWDAWRTVQWNGDPDGKRVGETDPFSLSEEEGFDALWRIVCLSTVSQVAVSKANLEDRWDTWVRGRRAVTRGRSVEPQTRAASNQNGEVVRASARTALERGIIDIWEELLGVEGIGVKDNFLELGGDSLIAIRIIGRIQELVGVKVPPSFFVNIDCAVEELAKEIVTMLTESQDPKMLQRILQGV
jgi:acyl transferase domain-containing protein/NAD(P)-dependent dehydrogenase (short-subunit alcohol dehydrogenase family)/acyl carrier protein